MKKVLLVLLSCIMCFGLFGCTKDLTNDEIKAKLEKKGYVVASIKVGSYGALSAVKDSEKITIIVCGTKDEAIKCQTDLEKTDFLSTVTYEQEGKYVFFGTAAGIKDFKKII